MAGLFSYPGFLGDIVRGDTRDFMIAITQDGSEVDITGGKFYVTIAADLDPDTTPELEILIDPPTDPTHGKTSGTISDTETYALEASVYFYSVRFINAAGAAYVLDIGQINIYDGVSSRIS